MRTDTVDNLYIFVWYNCIIHLYHKKKHIHRIKPKTKMSFNIQDITDSIRIKGNNIKINVLISSGKDGDYFVTVSPSLLVSGYGETEKEAMESFEENIRTFCDDLIKLSPEQKAIELRKLGFTKEQYHNKNFSKAYVDKNGVLQGLEPTTLKTSRLEATV